MENEKIMILSVKPYDLIDEKSGQRVCGKSIYYIQSVPTADQFDGYGFTPLKASLPFDLEIKSVPCLAVPVYSTQRYKGRLVLKLSSVKVLESVKLWK